MVIFKRELPIHAAVHKIIKWYHLITNLCFFTLLFHFQITPFWLYSAVIPKHAILLEIDIKGQIINSFQDPGGKVIGAGMSEGFEYENNVYLGSFSSPFLAKISTQDLYS